jgi:hypothetical protein
MKPPTNPNNTPSRLGGDSIQSSPLKLFRTEYEVIREAAEEVEADADAQAKAHSEAQAQLQINSSDNTTTNSILNVAAAPLNLNRERREKRGREDDDEDYDEEDEDQEEPVGTNSGTRVDGEDVVKRNVRSIPRKKGAKATSKPQRSQAVSNHNPNSGGNDMAQTDEDKNPFLV